MKDFYPIHIDLSGKEVVVIGGGKVATRKVHGLISSGANITVVSPQISDDIKKLIQDNTICWKEKVFSPTDIAGAFLIIVATNNQETNKMVLESALPQQLINAADDFHESNCIIPSMIKRGKLTISVSTNGASPTLTKYIRKSLEEMFDDRYESYIEFLSESRSFILQKVKDENKKRILLQEIVEDSRFIESSNREEDFQRLIQRVMNN
ncbi:NAD(P)-binding protein [Bacillus massilinigeriensis]|uniref:NAD(P)-binding protein n=1 Tax=Bacillus massilionigeriensis TaxID=1805475 RepID=UPI00096B5D97|nr:NAD(P)-binding protein [Bacillus massilionigeriensis]